MPNIDEAIEALLSYQQADMEGVIVLTSRQAIHEVADELKRLRGVAQRPTEPQWTEDALAIAFFDYSACTERRCGWTEPGDCDCRNAARKAVHWIKHVLPRSFPLASSLPSTNCSCGGDPGQPADHHDISCPMAISRPHREAGK